MKLTFIIILLSLIIASCSHTNERRLEETERGPSSKKTIIKGEAAETIIATIGKISTTRIHSAGEGSERLDSLWSAVVS